MSRLRATQLSARTLWVSGLVARVLLPVQRLPNHALMTLHPEPWWGVLTKATVVLIGFDLLLAYIRDPERFRRPTRAEILPSFLGAVAMASVILVAIIFATLLI